MPKLKKKPTKNKKTRKGLKLFLVFFGLVFLMLLLVQVVNLINKAVYESKSVLVNVDTEWGTVGDGPGQFKEPQDVAVDTQGNVYVSEFSGHRIQKFDSTGGPLLSIGKHGDDEGEFNQPSGLFVDAQGDIFVCDTFGKAKDSIGRIQEFDSRGKFLKAWNHNFFGPRSIVGANGRLYVADTGNHKVQVFDMGGNFQMEWGKFGTSNGMFREPVGITADPQGNIYVADSDNRRIQKFDGNGKFLSSFKVSTWRGKNDETPYLAFANGFLYASNASQNAVLQLDPDGKLTAIFRRKNDKAGFSWAAGVAVNAQNRVFVVEKGTGKIARFTVPAPSSK